MTNGIGVLVNGDDKNRDTVIDKWSHKGGTFMYLLLKNNES